MNICLQGIWNFGEEIRSMLLSVGILKVSPYTVQYNVYRELFEYYHSGGLDTAQEIELGRTRN